MRVKTAVRDRASAGINTMKLVESVVEVELNPGTFFGEEALVAAGQKKNAHVVAMQVSYLYMLSTADFQVVMEDYPECKAIFEVRAPIGGCGVGWGCGCGGKDL